MADAHGSFREEATERLRGTVLSIRHLIAGIVFLAAGVTVFDHAATSIRIFQVLVNLYRWPTNRLYKLLHWPQVLHLPHWQLMRDLTTIALVATAFAVAAGIAARRRFELQRDAICDIDGVMAGRGLDEEDEGFSLGAVAAAAGAGALIGGPIGALIGGLWAAAGAAMGADQARQNARNSRMAAQQACDDYAGSGLRLVATAMTYRFVFCVFVGLLVIVAYAYAEQVGAVLEAVNSAIQGRIDALVHLRTRA